MQATLSVAVDPGLDGGWAAVGRCGVDLRLVGYGLIPTMTKIKTKGKKAAREVDTRALVQAIRDMDRMAHTAFPIEVFRREDWYLSRVVSVEQVWPMPNQGSVSGFTFGRAYQACIDAALWALSLSANEPTLVPPRVWQKACPEEFRREDTKAMCRAWAKGVFPGEKFLKSPRSRVPHDGICDAVCIALWHLQEHQD